MSLTSGDVIEDKYRIVRLLGEGGMGAVYEGENTRINRRVAIKVLHAAFASNADVVKRFEREAQAAGRIGNDHILEVLDLGSLDNGDRFMVMEYLDGEPLSERIGQRGRMSPAELSGIIRQVLTGLAAAHDAGILHRDLKPDNIFILKEKAGQRDFAKIIDFGISKFQPMNNEMKMTQTGAVMGTPYYMSPEQARGDSVTDARSDIYSMGVIMYEAVTGSVPYDAATFNQLMFKIVLSEPTPLAETAPEIDAAFASLIDKAMARDAAHRFQSAREFEAALLAWEQHGLAVAVPPRTTPSVPGADTAVGLGLPGSGLSVQGGQTSGSWASSQAGVPPKKSPVLLLLGIGVVGLSLLAGGSFAAWKWFGGQASVPAVAASGNAVPVQIPASASAAALAAPPPHAEPAGSATAAPEPVASEPAPGTKPAPPVRHPLAQSKPTAKPKPAAPKPAAPKPTTPKPTTPKPTTPDFGY